MPTQIRKPLNSPKENQAVISGNFTIGAAGAVSTYADLLDMGVTVTKTATKTGRYSVAFPKAFAKCKAVHVNMVGPADTAFGNTDANMVQERNKTTSGIDLQGILASSGADTDFASGTVITVTIVVEGN